MRSSALFAIPLTLTLVHNELAPQQNPQSSARSSSSSSTFTSASQSAIMHGDILMARKQYSAAIDTYLKAVQGVKKDAELFNKIGIAYQQLGALNLAERYYKKAQQADKNFSSATNNLGTLEYEKKHYGKAIKYYKKSLATHVDLAALYSNLGYAYFANKQYPEAMNSFTKALSIDANVFARKGGMGEVLQQKSATDPALFNFLLAKSFAKAGDAERTAHYLKVARDDGYKDFLSAEKDPAFASVIKDPRVQEVLHLPASYSDEERKPVSN